MDDTFFNKCNKTITNLSQKRNSLFLWYLLIFLEITLKIIIADLLNYVIVMTAFHNIHDLNDILGFKKLQNLNFGEESTFKIFVLIDFVKQILLNFF